jgi:hypothetical protein
MIIINSHIQYSYAELVSVSLTGRPYNKESLISLCKYLLHCQQISPLTYTPQKQIFHLKSELSNLHHGPIVFHYCKIESHIRKMEKQK